MTSTLICSAAWRSGWRVCCRSSRLLACSSLAAAPDCSAGICLRAIPMGLSSSPTSRRPWSSNAGAISRSRASSASASRSWTPHARRQRALRPHRHQHDAALARRSCRRARTARKRLTPGGALIYATISGESFPEWREVLEEQGLPIGLLDIPELPGIVDEERIVADADTLGFLRRMKAVGGLTPREGYAADCRQAGFAAPSAPPTKTMAAASPGTSSMGGWRRASRAPRSARHRRGRARRR